MFIIYLLASINIYSLKVKRGVELTLSKSKDGALNVKSIDVYTKNPNKTITDLERFQCGGFDIGGAKLTKETKQCKTGQFSSTYEIL